MLLMICGHGRDQNRVLACTRFHSAAPAARNVCVPSNAVYRLEFTSESCSTNDCASPLHLDRVPNVQFIDEVLMFDPRRTLLGKLTNGILYRIIQPLDQVTDDKHASSVEAIMAMDTTSGIHRTAVLGLQLLTAAQLVDQRDEVLDLVDGRRQFGYSGQFVVFDTIFFEPLRIIDR